MIESPAFEEMEREPRFHQVPLVTEGKFVSVGRVRSEWWEGIHDPLGLIASLKRSRVKPDIFSFIQRLPETSPKYDFYMELDNVAAIRIRDYNHWWKSQIKDKTRNMVRKSQRQGVEVRVSDYSDEFVKGIMEIYNETPTRQGRPFPHYGKDFETVKRENGSYLERSEFIGAYCQGELVGFIKLVYDHSFATMMQIISKIRERNKAPTNALVAKAVERCAERGILFLVYSKFTYGKKGVDPLTDFKRHNAFERVDLPRYYVPLTFKGRLALKIGLHRGITELLPRWIVGCMLHLRNRWYRNRGKGNGLSKA
jgi:hypothetical protein